MKLEYPTYSKQTYLEGVYSWNKMWSLKSLVMLKCESRTSPYASPYSVLIVLEMASLDNLFLCSAGQQAWLCS